MTLSTVPSSRIRMLGPNRAINPDGQFVLYWMTSARRTGWNYGLQRARDLAVELNKPLVVLEALRVDYRWASVRLHRFVIEGMRDNARAFLSTPVTYFPYVESAQGEGKGLLVHLLDQAVAAVTDDFPSFFLPRMISAAAHQSPIRLELVDSNGVLPMATPDRTFLRAYDFRRYLQRTLPEYLLEMPEADPLAKPTFPALQTHPLPPDRWPMANFADLIDGPGLDSLPIDQSIGAAPQRGGEQSAGTHLRQFVGKRLARYDSDRNALTDRSTSELSPYLHFGHISSHEVVNTILELEGWTPLRLADSHSGKRTDWWGLPPAAEAFLDQLVTWRELGYNMASRETGYDRYESLPDWARGTMEQHISDLRPHLYTVDEFAAAETHDPIWNAAQRELKRDGRIHNYLRMLWGKKILEWTTGPREALDVMIELNNRYAIDGRNPNSYSGIFWCLGRYDRPWGPEREIFGRIRFMSSDNTARKLKLKPYLDEFGGVDPKQ